MNRAGATQSSDCRTNRTTQTNRGNDSVTIHTVTIFIYYILFNNIYFMYYFMYYNYNIQSRIIWYWNYTRFQFNILYYNSILCLYILIPGGFVERMGDRFV